MALKTSPTLDINLAMDRTSKKDELWKLDPVIQLSKNQTIQKKKSDLAVDEARKFHPDGVPEPNTAFLGLIIKNLFTVLVNLETQVGGFVN